jgi:DNA mismatch endonuclease (patch repair protein)
MDIVDAATRSRMMAGIRGKNTRPEVKVRSFLHSKGFRYRLHDRGLPGSPDIVLPKYKTAIFVHGCFWHRHTSCPKATNPANNAEKWQAKFTENLARDKRNIPELIGMGWYVIVIWECGLGKLTVPKDLEWLVKAIRKPKQPYLEWPNAK